MALLPPSRFLLSWKHSELQSYINAEDFTVHLCDLVPNRQKHTLEGSAVIHAALPNLHSLCGGRIPMAGDAPRGFIACLALQQSCLAPTSKA